MPPALTLTDYAKYPFLESFASIAHTIPYMSMPLVRILETDDGKKSIERAKTRIIVAINKKDTYMPRDVDVKIKISIPVQTIMAYGIARMIVSCTTQSVIDRFANSEAERAVGLISKEPEQKREQIEKELKFDRDSRKISIVEYVPLHLTKYDDKFKLINCNISKGYVILDEKFDMNILLKEKIKKLILHKLPLDIQPDAKDLFQPAISEIMSKYDSWGKEDYGEVEQDDFPPCIKNIINVIKKKENPTHFGRFALVAFCDKIGMNVTDITSLFQSVKDFEISTTLYQIEHITGKKGGTKYMAPACSAMKTNNLCRAGNDPICSRVKHPLGYYSSIKRRKKKKEVQTKDL
jgi:DNA primase large subunit